jgi:hypothetical protein
VINLAEQTERTSAMMEAAFGTAWEAPEMQPERSDSYSASLAGLAERYSRVAQSLAKAESTRRSKLAALLDGARLRGVDELLRHLDAVRAAFTADPVLCDLAPLISRASAEIETALEATLSGYLAVASDAMRDVMEIEMLLLDFSLDPSRISQWLTSTSRDRWSNFRPAKVRERLCRVGVGRYRNLTRDPDYAAHSEALHVSPHQHPLMAKGVHVGDGSLVPDGGFWELFEHARRLLVAIDAVRDSAAATTWPNIPRGDDLLEVGDAWARTQQMQELYLALLTAPVELREELGREPTTGEILERAADRLSQQRFDLRLPFMGAGRVRRVIARVARAIESRRAGPG